MYLLYRCTRGAYTSLKNGYEKHNLAILIAVTKQKMHTQNKNEQELIVKS